MLRLPRGCKWKEGGVVDRRAAPQKANLARHTLQFIWQPLAACGASHAMRHT